MIAASSLSCGGELGAAGLVVDAGQFLALLDHLLQQAEDVVVAGLALAGAARLDILVLERRLDEPHGGEPALFAGLQGVLHFLVKRSRMAFSSMARRR